MPHLLELFSGTGSVGRAFRAAGWEVTSVDLDRKSRPDICCDILDFQLSALEGRPLVDLVWASPPCTHYSIARSTRAPRDLEGSDRLVQKTLDIVQELGAAFFMENPATGLLKTRAVAQGLPMRVVDYCAYGALYRKRTAIWTNTDWRPRRPLCRYDCAGAVLNPITGKMCHLARAQRGPSAGATIRHQSLSQLYSLPPALCEELAEWATEQIRSL
jgi:hypothetical protein